MANDIQFLHSTVTGLRKAGMEVFVFGGWAEELMNTINPRPHYDVDLLYIGKDFAKVDEFLSSQSYLEEIKAKHFSHKRAFLSYGIMVELLLLKEENGRFVTNLWGEYRLEWPEIVPVKVTVSSVGDIPVVNPSIVYFYQSHSAAINTVRDRHIAEARCDH